MKISREEVIKLLVWRKKYMEINERHCKEFVKKGIKAYEVFLGILREQKKPKASVIDVAKTTGIIFGMRD
jgi:hypothetical protein